MSQNTECNNAQTNCSTFVKGLLIGSAIGAAAALLLAPKSGRELRADIGDKAQQVGGKTKELATDLGSRTAETVKNVGSKAGAVVSSVKEASKEFAATVKEATAGTADQLKEATADVAEEVAEELKKEE
ncbi:YtxH domain-containing protein [Paenibacillus alvei]|uniref:YtxH domain-containing protein n=1 Tax=Paenibacillus alvei TaxID=44250 RepID=UPI0002880881|nr:YtxH domain-containing protein [Paenibacillus alvei]EJW19217.1 hypothetical protein PAV_1c01880 [Paenibacillus alvei DSM 29]MBG9734805.1 gas vesicle protein [Paenibacillus alvei]MBG9744680.1 gas vesicle protein [Paenibacillus alvei]MCY9542642.1 YtxH domain-containing protein [Paenibacillus alvei]MCY9578904.1 YtxH domain-containing protein [Paenibacillus alvei]